jgi:hypothetical protein
VPVPFTGIPAKHRIIVMKYQGVQGYEPGSWVFSLFPDKTSQPSQYPDLEPVKEFDLHLELLLLSFPLLTKHDRNHFILLSIYPIMKTCHRDMLSYLFCFFYFFAGAVTNDLCPMGLIHNKSVLTGRLNLPVPGKDQRG